MTTPNRPPSCDKLKPKLKECPSCGGQKVALIHSDTDREKIAFCDTCYTHGPQSDNNGAKWNSIPRRLEVAEFLRLVDEKIISPPTPAEGRLLQYATKLMKEWNL